MDPIVSVIAILGALLVGAISPGPSFVLVARTAIAQSRLDGLAAACGMGVGAVVFAVLALLGLHAVLAQVPWLYLGLKLAGGAYLVHLAVRLWRGAATPLTVAPAEPGASGLRRSFALALATQLSNPKTAVVFGSVFAALLPAEVPAWVFVALPPLIFLQETAWYAVVAVTFSAERPRAAYLRSKGWIDRGAGGVMGLLGGRLIVETAP